MASPSASGEDAARPLPTVRTVPWLLAAAAVTAVVTALALLVAPASRGRIEVMDLMSDPAEVLGSPWYVGAVSDLNLMVWAAGVALFVVAALGLARSARRLAVALAWLGALTAAVTVDDRFVLHEIVLPHVTGLPQIAFHAAYAVAAAAVLLRYGRVLLAEPERVLLVVGACALALSIGLDVLGWDTTWRRVAEESAKLLGALLWTFFPASIIVRRLAWGAPRTP